MLNFFMKGSRMTLRHEKIQHLPGKKTKDKNKQLSSVKVMQGQTLVKSHQHFLIRYLSFSGW